MQRAERRSVLLPGGGDRSASRTCPSSRFTRSAPTSLSFRCSHDTRSGQYIVQALAEMCVTTMRRRQHIPGLSDTGRRDSSKTQRHRLSRPGEKREGSSEEDIDHMNSIKVRDASPSCLSITLRPSSRAVDPPEETKSQHGATRQRLAAGP